VKKINQNKAHSCDKERRICYTNENLKSAWDLGKRKTAASRKKHPWDKSLAFSLSERESTDI
jgi:hypothetical protein